MDAETRERAETHEKVAQILDKAADLIRANGLAKGTMLDNQGRHCVRGALMAASGDCISHAAEAERALFLLLRQRGLIPDGENCGFLGSFAVPPWNDAVDTTADDVIKMLEEAARIKRGDE